MIVDRNPEEIVLFSFDIVGEVMSNLEITKEEAEQILVDSIESIEVKRII